MFFTRKPSLIAAPGLALALMLVASAARATPPGSWSIGVERLFGASRAWIDYGYTRDTQTAIGLGTQYLGRKGYSATRLAFDHVFDFGLSLGTAIGYERRVADYAYDDDHDETWLFAPRVGFVLQPLPELLVWPRVGVTAFVLNLGSIDGDRAATSLECPVIYLLPGRGLGVSLSPQLDLGYDRSSDTLFGLVPTGESVTELSLTFGAHAFF
jgi:hypothetical protein